MQPPATRGKMLVQGAKVFFWFLFSVLVLSVVHMALFSPAYTFPAPAPFSGSVWFNPYQELDGKHWKLGNFQV